MRSRTEPEFQSPFFQSSLTHSHWLCRNSNSVDDLPNFLSDASHSNKTLYDSSNRVWDYLWCGIHHKKLIQPFKNVVVFGIKISIQWFGLKIWKPEKCALKILRQFLILTCVATILDLKIVPSNNATLIFEEHYTIFLENPFTFTWLTSPCNANTDDIVGFERSNLK